jgi:hypothetical protein
MELDVTWYRAVSVWWSFLWRAIIAAFFGMVVALANCVFVTIVGLTLRLPSPAIQTVGLLLGIVVVLAVTVVPMKLILGKDYGEFRLVLLSKTQSQPSAKDSASAEAYEL